MADTSEKAGKKEAMGKALTLEDKKFIAIDQLKKEEKKTAIKALSPDELVKYRKFRDHQRLEKAQDIINKIKSRERKADTKFKILLGGWLLQQIKENRIQFPKLQNPLETTLKAIQKYLKDNPKDFSFNPPSFIKLINEWDKLNYEKFVKSLKEPNTSKRPISDHTASNSGQSNPATTDEQKPDPGQES